MACVGVPPKGTGVAKLFDSYKGVPSGWSIIEIPKAPAFDGQLAILEGLELSGHEIDPTLSKYLVAQGQIRADGQRVQAALAMSQENRHVPPALKEVKAEAKADVKPPEPAKVPTAKP
jgi:hypothetical protein